MHIDFESSGGFAGLRLTFSGDPSDLPEPTRTRLQLLVAEAGLLPRPAAACPRSAPPCHPDTMTCRLTISDAGHSVTVCGSDGQVSAPVAALFGLLRTLARGRPPRP